MIILNARELWRYLVDKIPFSSYSYVVMGITYSMIAYFLFSFFRICVLDQIEVNRSKDSYNNILDADFLG